MTPNRKYRKLFPIANIEFIKSWNQLHERLQIISLVTPLMNDWDRKTAWYIDRSSLHTYAKIPAV